MSWHEISYFVPSIIGFTHFVCITIQTSLIQQHYTNKMYTKLEQQKQKQNKNYKSLEHFLKTISLWTSMLYLTAGKHKNKMCSLT